MENFALKNDPVGVYNAVFEYSEVGLEVADNPLLKQVLVNLLPATRRVQFFSIAFRLNEIRQCAVNFRTIVKSLKDKNTALGVGAIREYLKEEADSVVRILEVHGNNIFSNDYEWANNRIHDLTSDSVFTFN